MSEVKLHLGDCLEILPTLADNSVDAVITDIPYGTTACSWDEVIPFDEMWTQVKRVTDVFITTASQPFTSKLVMSNLDWFRYEWIWWKNKCNNYMNSRNQPRKLHENVLVFYDKQPQYNPQLLKGLPYRDNRIVKSGNIRMGINEQLVSKVNNNGYRYPESIIKFENVPNVEHPTQKPLGLLVYLVNTYTNEDDIVLDFCFGSGTTGVACVQTGRNFIGIEIEERYFNIARKRIKEAQLQLRLPFP